MQAILFLHKFNSHVENLKTQEHFKLSEDILRGVQLFYFF